MPAAKKPSRTVKTRAPTTRKRKKTARPTASAEPADRLGISVAVFEGTKADRERARDVLTQLGCDVAAETTAIDVASRCSTGGGLDVVIAGFPGGKSVVTAAAHATDGPVIVAALKGPAASAIERCAKIGADLFVVRPHGAESLAATLRAATAIVDERAKVRALSSSEAMLRERLLRYGQADAETGFRHFDFFRQLLVMEIKRAKRYGYPLAGCLIALDPWMQGEPPPEVNRVLRSRVSAAISSCIREIDMPVDLNEDRFLAFLPYTDLVGAERVGERIAHAVRSFGTVRGGDEDYRVSVSVGIAATRPGKPMSFARLMRDATSAVRAAQLKGGGRVVVRK